MLRNYIRIAWRNIRRNKLFAFISIGGNVFVLLLAAVIILVAALATIGVQTIRSALANPVNSLRSE